MEPPACPESISEPPRLVFSSWPWAAGNIRCCFSIFFSKKPTSRKPSGIKSKSKKLLQVILYLSTFQQENRCLRIFLKDFSISLLQPSWSSRKLTKPLFFNWSLLGLVLKRLCHRQVPHVGSHFTSSFVGFPTLEKRRRKDAPNLSSPILQRAKGWNKPFRETPHSDLEPV